MRYAASSPLGEVIESLIDEDDSTKTFAAPWPLNFFGTKYEGICVTTNGGVYPVVNGTTGCQNEYDMNLENLALESQAPMIAVLAADADLGKCDAARVAQRDGAGDGFGRPCTIYIDTAATIGGRDAVVVTWYRVSQYYDENDPTLENTYQLALLKRDTVNGATVGFDFDLEFNYGTVMDPEDGYSAETPDDGCESLTDDCRWGIGVASFDPGIVDVSGVTETMTAETTDAATEGTEPEVAEAEQGAQLEPVNGGGPQAVGYEFFAATKVADLADDGATPLIANSLGTDVLGRYTCGMINGVAVGCDPVSMQQLRPELAETGADESTIALVAAAMVLALAVIVTGATMVRRPARRIATQV